jgi:hypothetical protein
VKGWFWRKGASVGSGHPWEIVTPRNTVRKYSGSPAAFFQNIRGDSFSCLRYNPCLSKTIEDMYVMAHKNTALNDDSLLQYEPNRLLDKLIEDLYLKNDAALSRVLDVAPPVISKIRHHKLPVGASMLIRMHEVSAMSIADLRSLMGDKRDRYRSITDTLPS